MPRQIVRVTVVLADGEDFAGMNEEWLRWFPANPPARQGAKLPATIPGLKVPIAAIKGDQRPKESRVT
jgi:2-iminobutanoate/2-iminopropanoate deaminase